MRRRIDSEGRLRLQSHLEAARPYPLACACAGRENRRRSRHTRPREGSFVGSWQYQSPENRFPSRGFRFAPHSLATTAALAPRGQQVADKAACMKGGTSMQQPTRYYISRSGDEPTLRSVRISQPHVEGDGEVAANLVKADSRTIASENRGAASPDHVASVKERLQEALRKRAITP